MPDQRVKSLPLEGKQILVTRTREQADALSQRLQAQGAIPIAFPVIRIVPPQDWGPLDSALGKLGRDTPRPYYAWIVFTSANGVNIFCERLLSLGLHPSILTGTTSFGATEGDPRVSAPHPSTPAPTGISPARMESGVRVAAIGPATAAALARYGINADLVPTAFIAEGMAAALREDARQREESLKGKRILLPRAAEARKILVTELQRAGALVDEIAAYSTEAAAADDEQGRAVLRLLQNHQLDIITFTSSSTVRNFIQWLEGYGLAFDEALQPKVACIGPITAQTARQAGLAVDIEAQEFTIDGLVKAIVQAEGKQ